MVDQRAELAQLTRRDHDLAAGGDHVFDHGHTLAGDHRALGELRGAVRLGLLAHERRRDARAQRQRRRNRNATELQPGQHLGAGWQQWLERGRYVGQQHRVGLEPILVEVLSGDLAGSQREGAGEAGDRIDPRGEGLKRHDRQSVRRGDRASTLPAQRWPRAPRRRRTRARSPAPCHRRS